MVSETVDVASVPAPAPRRRRRVRVATALIGGVLVALAGVGLAAHWLDTSHQVLLVLAAASWLLVPASVLALVVFLVGRHWLLTPFAVVALVLQVVAYGPLFVAQTPPANSDDVHVMTQNMLYGRANAASIVARLRSSDVDVLALEELTPQAVDALYAAGIKDVMPYAWWRSAPGATGTGIWSRIPFSQPTAERGFSMFTISATLQLPTGQQVSLVAVHPSAPYPQDPQGWLDDLASLKRLMQSGLPAGPVIVAGDFNATWDHARFRGLLTDGYRDAADQAGAGIVRSWPADEYVRVIGIDHVLTRGAVATSFDLVATPDTDHRGVLTTIAVPTN